MFGRSRLAFLLSALVAFAAAALPSTALGASEYHVDGDPSEWIGESTNLAGETRTSRGELIHTDYVYDDYGANINGGPDQPDFRSNLAPTRGDYRYPTNADRYGYNAADLRELRLGADSTGLYVLAQLQTMKEAGAAAVMVAIDMDHNQATGSSQPWPHGVGIDTPGVERFITLWGTGGSKYNGQLGRLELSRSAYDLEANAYEASIPWNRLGWRFRADTNVRIYAVAGLFNPATEQFVTPQAGTPTATAPGGGAPGSTAAFDLGFDSNEASTRALGSHWGEEKQADALATRNIASITDDISIAALERRESDDYQPQAGRFYDRIFRSGESYDAAGRLCSQSSDPCVNEGINLKNDPSSPGGSPEAQFLSPHQPYGLYIPADYQPGTPAPLLVNGHSLDVNHNEYAVVSPNLYNQLGDQRSSFVITPLARGMDTWYISAGLQDVFEAWADLKAQYSIDDESTSVGGYSMGGYMTYRLGLLMPDSFAAAAAYVGPPAYQLWAPPAPPNPPGDYQVAGQTNNIVYNGMNIPFEINNGGVDELVPATGAQEQAQTFSEFGNPHEFYFYPTADHFTLIGVDEWGHTRDWLDAHPTRDTTPSEVRYKRYPAMDLPQYGRRFDGAYWVDGMVVRDVDDCAPGEACQSTFGLVEAYTMGHGRTRSTSSNYTRAYAGPPPAEVSGTIRGDASLARRNFFDARFASLEAITFDTGTMGLDPTKLLEARLTVGGGGPFKLGLRGNFPTTATAEIQEIPFGPWTPVPVTHTADGIELDLTLTSQHNLKIKP